MVEFKGFEKYFRVISYCVALCGLFALFTSGGVGVLVFSGFLFAALFAWILEDTKWQISERLAVTIVGIAILGFFADWRFQITGVWADGIFEATGLARLILFFSAVKLLQKKADKDWIFVYIISFFEVLLAAGLSISPMFLVSLLLYLFFTTCAIIAFEIRKSSRTVDSLPNNQKDTGITRIVPDERKPVSSPAFRLPAASIVLLAGITIVGLPIFFALPRSSAGGFGNDYSSQVNVTGFSDSVTLGTIGTLQQSDAIVMRVRIDQNNNENLNRLLWRGVALDRFDNRRWTKSDPIFRRPFAKNENDLVVFFNPPRKGKVTIQTFYLEPLSTNVLFALSRPFAMQGVNVISKDAEDALLGFRNGNERLSYSVFSDTSVPESSVLRDDMSAYGERNAKYLQVPADLDPRIAELAASYLRDSGATNRFDIAETIEARLQDDYGYSLEMKAGGPQPVADFLFNVKTGHCEYFATAMAMMLRTQGVAARVVNGFQSGDYNETAGVYVVRQQNAHSWVEVFFPTTSSWVAFDPTPPDSLPGGVSNSFFGAISGYIEALETFWIQYVVSYDGQEQKSLLRRFRDGLQGYVGTGSDYLETIRGVFQEWVAELRGDEGVFAGFRAAGIGFAVVAGFLALGFALVRILRFILRLRIFRWIVEKLLGNQVENRIEFYARMERVLLRAGFERQKFQTPFEFALTTEIPEVESMTEKYNYIRFGGHQPDDEEKQEIEKSMEVIEEKVADLKEKKKNMQS